MKPKRLKYWQRYVDDLKDPMRLTNWNVTVIPYSEADGGVASAGASISACEHRQDADLMLGKDWEAYTPEQCREYITHELTHLHLWFYMNFSDSLADRLGKEAADIAGTQSNHLLEVANDEIAKAVAPFLPLPPERKEKAA